MNQADDYVYTIGSGLVSYEPEGWLFYENDVLCTGLNLERKFYLNGITELDENSYPIAVIDGKLVVDTYDFSDVSQYQLEYGAFPNYPGEAGMMWFYPFTLEITGDFSLFG